MSRADVVVPIYRDVALTRACVESVLAHAGEVLDRVFLVNDCSPEAGMVELLDGLRFSHPRVRVFHNPRNLGFVQASNLGLAASERDVVLLNSDTQVTPGWLEALLAVFDADPRVAALSPLSNNAGMCSVPDYGGATLAEHLPRERLQLAGLPPFTEMPTAPGFCLLFRRTALEALGPLDPAFGRGYHEENDWCQRARSAGWRVGRANRAFVFHEGEVSFQGARAQLDARNGWRLVTRYPQFFAQARAFDGSPSARLAGRAVRAALGTLSVWSDADSFRRALSGAGLLLRGEGCDVAFVRADQATPAEAAQVAVLEDADLARLQDGRLDSFLAASQGVVASPALSELLGTRFPALRRFVVGQNALGEFARELVLNPDARALALQAERRAGPG